MSSLPPNGSTPPKRTRIVSVRLHDLGLRALAEDDARSGFPHGVRVAVSLGDNEGDPSRSLGAWGASGADALRTFRERVALIDAALVDCVRRLEGP